jgi:GMP reductase
MRKFDFQDINLIPRKCIVGSRSECDTTISLGKFVFNMPVVPANMECVINEEVAIKLARAGYFYIYHRFNINLLEFVLKMKSLNLYTSISLGVNENDYNLLNLLKENDCIPDFITIDIAHGHSIKMKSMITWISENYPSVYIIAGNVSTSEAVKDLELWGANAIKVGIGPGSACTTYTATGFGSRNAQASVIEECASVKNSAIIIADGGIKDPGDIAKALVLGADMIMVGGMFSALTDSPGSTVRGTDGQLYKEFWGSASAFQSGKVNRIEGTKKLLPLKNRSTLEEMNYLKECLQSAISYGGGNTLLDFKFVKYF